MKEKAQEKESTPETKALFVIGEVNETTVEGIVKDIVETDWIEDNIKEVHMYICSEGGYLRDCFAVIDIIQQIKMQFNLTIRTYGLGEVASAGFFLFLLGDDRFLFPSCRVFVHEHITINDEKTYGERLKADKTEEREVYDNYVRYTAERLQIGVTKAKNLLKKNKWLTKKEIKAHGIQRELDE
jgi:ATP-dependent protease ClpP protease subunit